MLVKAKWNVRDAAGWHKTGDVFNTDSDLGEAVEVLNGQKKAEPKKPEPAKQEKVEEPKPAEEKPKTTTRRKKISE